MIPKPCVEEVICYLDTWSKLENYVLQESRECSSFCGHSLLASQKKGNNL